MNRLFSILSLTVLMACNQNSQAKTANAEVNKNQKSITEVKSDVHENKDIELPIEKEVVEESNEVQEAQNERAEVNKEENTTENVVEKDSKVEAPVSEKEPTEKSTSKSDVLQKQSLKDFIEKNKEKLADIQKEPTPDPKPESPQKETKAELNEKKEEKPEKEITTEEIEKPEPPQEVAKPNHQLFSNLLGKYVSRGDVNYSGFATDIKALEEYLNELESAKIDDTWSREDRLVYWINAYNAYTIKLILDNYPLKSITDLEGGKPWDKKWIPLQGKTLSLNNIENDIIRPRFKEPRIHFAVNCAAKSCPPIANVAYTPATLEALLQVKTEAFINDKNHNQITASSASVSKIFEWYAEDFGDLRTFLNKYSATTFDGKVAIQFNEYDWSLNQK